MQDTRDRWYQREDYSNPAHLAPVSHMPQYPVTDVALDWEGESLFPPAPPGHSHYKSHELSGLVCFLGGKKDAKGIHMTPDSVALCERYGTTTNALWRDEFWVEEMRCSLYIPSSDDSLIYFHPLDESGHDLWIPYSVVTPWPWEYPCIDGLP